MEKSMILREVLLFALSVGGSIVMAIDCDPRKRRKLSKIGNEAPISQPSDLLCVLVFIYFSLALFIFYIDVYDIGIIFTLIISLFAGSLVSLLFLGFSWALALVIPSLRRLHNSIITFGLKINPVRRPRYNKGMQFYFSFLAIIFISIGLFMVFPGMRILSVVPALTFFSALKISIFHKEIYAFYNFLHDMIFNDRKIVGSRLD